MKWYPVMLLLLASTVSAGAEPVRAEFELTKVTIHVLWFDSYADLRADLRKREVDAKIRRTIGLAAYKVEDDGSGTCVIWVVRPKRVDSNKVRTIGHEVMHCTNGDYHERK